jgi:hypothetical protein
LKNFSLRFDGYSPFSPDPRRLLRGKSCGNGGGNNNLKTAEPSPGRQHFSGHMLSDTHQKLFGVMIQPFHWAFLYATRIVKTFNICEDCLAGFTAFFLNSSS